jgi:hypothetical protein
LGALEKYERTTSSTDISQSWKDGSKISKINASLNLLDLALTRGQLSIFG